MILRTIVWVFLCKPFVIVQSNFRWGILRLHREVAVHYLLFTRKLRGGETEENGDKKQEWYEWYHFASLQTLECAMISLVCVQLYHLFVCNDITYLCAMISLICVQWYHFASLQTLGFKCFTLTQQFHGDCTCLSAITLCGHMTSGNGALTVATQWSTYVGMAKIIRLVEIRRTSAFLTVFTVPYRNTPYNTVQVRSVWKDGVRPYSTVPPYRTMLTVIWPFGSNFDPKHSLSFCNN